jgi:hypothetical protein
MKHERFELFQGNPTLERLLAKARKVNAERDIIDRKNGFATPHDSGLAEWLRTIMTAIASGLSTLSKDETGGSIMCIIEGLAMLQDAELVVRNLQKPK